jgi:hypothetical protein
MNNLVHIQACTTKWHGEGLGSTDQFPYKRAAAPPKKTKTEPSWSHGLRAATPPVNAGALGDGEVAVTLVVGEAAAEVAEDAAAEEAAEEEAAADDAAEEAAAEEAEEEAADEEAAALEVAAGLDAVGLEAAAEEEDEAAAEEVVVAADVEAGAGAAVAAQEQTASAEEMTARPVWTPQAESTQF